MNDHSTEYEKTVWTKTAHFLAIILILILFSTLFYYRYLLYFVGYPGFGNFFIPLSRSSLNWQIIWFPYGYNGTIGTTPMSGAINLIVFNIPIYIFSSIVPMIMSGKLYVVLSVVVLGSSVFYFSRAFTEYWLIRFFGTIFYLLLPINLMIMSGGDPNSLVYLSFAFFSYRFLWSSYNRKAGILNLWLIFSIIFLVLSIGDYQVFFLGTVIYFILSTYWHFKNLPINLKSLASYLGRTLISLAILALLILPEIYPLFLGGLNNTFIFNPGLGSFIGNSSSLLNTLILRGYPPNLAWISVSSSGVKFFSVIWNWAEITLLLVLIIFPVFLKSKSLLFFSFIVFIGAMFGSGFLSPISFLNEYLYMHLPGYNSLNGSYFWDWIFLSFFYLILFLNLAELIKSKGDQLIKKLNIFKKKIPRTLKIGRGAFAILLIFVLATPVVTQGYYGNSGINNTWGKSMPSYFPELQSELSKLVNNSYAGVAYFNPDINLYAGNKSDNFVNPLILFPNVRTAMLHYYASPQLIQNRYFFYVYRLFYLNETKELGGLMSLAGIQYFVYLKGLNSNSYNAGWMPWSENSNTTLLMSYQKGVSVIVNNNNFTIYRNNYYMGNALSSKNLVLSAGGLPELNQLFTDGFNLTGSAVVTTNSLGIVGLPNVLPYTNKILIPDTNSLIGIVLSNLTKVNPLGYTVNSDPSYGWASSFDISENGPMIFDTLNPFSLTYVRSTLLIPTTSTSQGNSTLWMHIYFTDNPSYGYHGLYVNYTGGSLHLNTSSYQGITNKFAWVGLPINTTKNGKVEITSTGSINAIRSMFFAPRGYVSRALSNLSSYMRSHNVTIYMDIPGYNIAPASNLSSPRLQNFDSSSGNVPNRGIYLSNAPGYTNTIDIKIPKESGWLYLNVASTDGGVITAHYDGTTSSFGYSTQRFLPGNLTYSPLEIPVDRLTGSNLTLDVSGFVFIESIMFIPGTTSYVPASLQNFGGNSNYTYFEPNANQITKQNFTVLKDNSSYTFSGNVTVRNTANGSAVISYNTHLPFLYDYSMVANYSISSGLLVNVNSVRLGNCSQQSSLIISSDLFGYQDRYHNTNIFLTIYTTKSIENETLSFKLTVHFIDEPLLNLPPFNPSPKIYSVHNDQSGYLVSGRESSHIIVLRLPYYTLFSANGGSLRIVSGISGLNGIIIAKNGTSQATITVSFYKTEILLITADFLVVIVLVGIVLFRRFMLRGDTLKGN